MPSKYDDGESRLNEYEVIKKIGNGRFGEVFLVKHKRTQEFFCWKAISYRGLKEREKSQLVIEVNVMRELKHKNIVRYIDRFLNKANQKLYILMEFCDAGDLSRNIQKCYKMFGKIEEHAIVDITRQLLHALAYCHNLKDGPNGERVLHRDLKPQNIFLSTGIRHIGKITAQANNLNGRPIAKIGDFGLSKNIGIESMAHSCVGTPYYWSPELLLHETKSYDDKSDMWALGCIIYELCSGKTPFHKANNFSQLISELKRGPDLPIKGKSKELNMLIKNLLNLSAKERPSALQCLGYQIIKNVGPPGGGGVAPMPGAVVTRRNPSKEHTGLQLATVENGKNGEDVNYGISQNVLINQRNEEQHGRRSSSSVSRQSVNNVTNKDDRKYPQDGGTNCHAVSGHYGGRVDKDHTERTRIEKENAHRKALEMKILEKKRIERLERERVERLERGRVERLERERVERLERERVDRLERERVDRLERERVDRLERDRLEKARRNSYYLKSMENGLSAGGVPTDGSSVGATEGRNHSGVRSSVHCSIQSSVRGGVHDSVRSGVHDSVRGGVHDSVRSGVHDSVRGSVHDSVRGGVHDSVRSGIPDNVRKSSGVKVEGMGNARAPVPNQGTHDGSFSRGKDTSNHVSSYKPYIYDSRKEKNYQETFDRNEVHGYRKNSPITTIVPSSHVMQTKGNTGMSVNSKYLGGAGYGGYSNNHSATGQYVGNPMESVKYREHNKYSVVGLAKNAKEVYKETVNPICSTESQYERVYNHGNRGGHTHSGSGSSGGERTDHRDGGTCKSNRVSNIYFNDNARRSVSALPHMNAINAKKSSIYNNTCDEGTLSKKSVEVDRSYKHLEKDREYLLEKRKMLMEKEKGIYNRMRHNNDYAYAPVRAFDRGEDKKPNELDRRNRSLSMCMNEQEKRRGSSTYNVKEYHDEEEELHNSYTLQKRNMYALKNFTHKGPDAYTCR
ncbi:NIMA related kinase 1, putative [Plasmodium knowlesi strain H]|uniref:non-specific serine/threonine protein kinase n=3 Tax=Plasmodium knowlesi TaxID=5850 RepID=A0A5K1V8K6_PLAKH|nr:NIMA related kinase 1, putative [Plasmodium knowlesi strain H]OTN63908.1 putative NIMA related kinase 1 [Plasmodium knowlesi]CAA9991072.1 NIMA related kinase 1, putative [Plasmodium knowlesi strain H]SBO20636.1 NIMA related kinase 1, putative [Plasmodium knowlesi strain H]SBO21047.1 NIMA related kinase 1, putative [Plasmodium knowlesi strain H]VVS80546.1 NIMA related kinase 1, putative [Plasmodium knowlesi strain H]|eukprot:XP_002262354.1 nima-related protein kinase, putative [Plasmodium knowlesi strain H]